MVNSAEDLVRLFHQALKPLGFRKAGRTWRLETPETIIVVNLQRSQWSDRYYLNLGAQVKSVGDDPSYARNRTRPGLVDCHYRIRLENLFTDEPVPPAKITPDRSKVHALLDLDDPAFDGQTRESELRTIIEQRMMPFLELCKTEAGIRIAIMDKLHSSHMTSRLLRERLEIPMNVGIKG